MSCFLFQDSDEIILAPDLWIVLLSWMGHHYFISLSLRYGSHPLHLSMPTPQSTIIRKAFGLCVTVFTVWRRTRRFTSLMDKQFRIEYQIFLYWLLSLCSFHQFRLQSFMNLYLFTLFFPLLLLPKPALDLPLCNQWFVSTPLDGGAYSLGLTPSSSSTCFHSGQELHSYIHIAWIMSAYPHTFLYSPIHP